MAVVVTKQKRTLRIEMPIEKPTPSRSGKTMIVASTHGNLTTDVRCRRRPIVVSVNAFVYPENNQHEQSPRKRNRRGIAKLDNAKKQ